MDSRRSMIDKLSARQISDPCRMYGEQSAVRFSEENTFYTISSASRGSSRQEARANDNIFNRESTVFGMNY
ncbi:hypothetical protein LSH36_550g01033 [Paralvinella palmiformis]|uniref:Uncharacterized protein n=1 Tax=Paralvinella palmiformis TaxID=53620 RepID=A0AAD9MVZ6_9ANNE|nr:hypothetical protein LSH36_550g01033 [Paralvinella palmiformis]